VSTSGKLFFPRLLSGVLIALLVTPFLHVQATFANPAVTVRVSISSAGLEGDLVSRTPSISADGQIIVFASEATNLVVGDTNNAQDIFLYHDWDHDWLDGTTERVSLNAQGQEANGASSWPEISSDGSTVAFSSTATNLVDGDMNGVEDVFVVDLQSGGVEQVSNANAASNQPVISSDGRFVAFVSAATNLVSGATSGLEEIYLFDRLYGSLQWVSVPLSGSVNDGPCGEVAISADGNWVAFSSSSTQLVLGDNNGRRDIFLWDRTAVSLERVSVTQTGDEAQGSSYLPALSADGQFIVFRSHASNLVADDTNFMGDIFLRDHLNGTLERINVSTTGEQALGGPSDEPAISADGRFTVFRSYATNLVPNDNNGRSDIFVRDLQGITSRASVDSFGLESNGSNYSPVINDDGAAIVFYSEADNLDLVLVDNNFVGDIFTHGQPTTAEPTDTPTATLTDTPTSTPTDTPTTEPTDTPVTGPTDTPTTTPEDTPVAEPTDTPTTTPEDTPAAEPTDTPTTTPEDTPAAEPTDTPTTTPEETPAAEHTDTPTAEPTGTPDTPKTEPTDTPTATPTNKLTETPTATPVVVDDSPCSRGLGFWKHENAKEGDKLSKLQLWAYRMIIKNFSSVFSEHIPLHTFEQAYDVLQFPECDMRAKARAHLLTAWFNFASGSFTWDTVIDLDKDDGPDSTIREVMEQIENIILDPEASNKILVDAKNLAAKLNQLVHGNSACGNGRGGH
jgi:Tol biopolymer transport system component